MDVELVEEAARNNAEWCDVVCGTHGIKGAFADDAWTSTQRTPPLYPDAVTLARGVSVEGLLTRVDATAEVSVKDSFAELDLAADGFEVLFDATWVRRPSARVTASMATSTSNGNGHVAWRTVSAPGAFATWLFAWSRFNPGQERVLLPALLDDPSVSVLAGMRDDEVVAGGVINRSGTCLGISNVFDGTGDALATLDGFADAAAGVAPGLPVVGYVSPEAIEAVAQVGFSPVAPLRVWMRD
jgi:hypothetical protein